MLDIQQLRKDTNKIAEKLKSRGFDFNVKAFLELESKRKDWQVQSEGLKSRINAVSKQIGINMARGEDQDEIIKEVLGLKSELKEIEDSYSDVQIAIDLDLMNTPNLPHDSVPVGKSEADNVKYVKSARHAHSILQ